MCYQILFVMIEATYSHRKLAVEILSKSFDSNKSVEYVIKGGAKRQQQIKSLMEYAFDMCMLFGEVYVSNNNMACALVLFPHQKRTTLKSVELDIKFLFYCSSIKKILQILKREEDIYNNHADEKYAHLLFLGVHPKEQGKGYGSKLLNELAEHYSKKHLNIYLETS
ncbi:MAG: GNAT family N-acetyltransferase, partial [Cytophaga sp.]|uniref:GNAT family N-acetyltransferase n=1 Tax=Cytophaga sp. TaxID=29535 RepID=UPI003F80A89B